MYFPKESIVAIPTQSTSEEKGQGQKFRKKYQCYILPVIFQAKYDLAWECNLGPNAWHNC